MRASGTALGSTLHPQFWWWVARATGIVAWAAATASVAWGLTVSGRLVRRRKLPAWLLDLHRYLGTLTLGFVAVHVIALVADSFVEFGLRELFVPMASAWRPGAVTWGVLALYGLVIIQVTSWGMRFLPRRVWHGVHLSAYAVFVASTVHGALSGADRAHPLVQALAVAGITVVVTLTVLRVLARPADAAAPVATPAAPGPAAGGPSDPRADRAAKLAAARAGLRREATAETTTPPEAEPAILG